MCSNAVERGNNVNKDWPLAGAFLRASRKPSRTTSLARRLARSVQTHEIVQVLRRTAEHYDVACALMTLECPEVKLVASWGTVPGYKEKAEALEPRLFRTIQRPLPMVIEDVAHEKLEECDGADPSFRFYASFPIILEAVYIGSVVMTSTAPHPYMQLKYFKVLGEAADEIAQLLQKQMSIQNSNEGSSSILTKQNGPF